MIEFEKTNRGFVIGEFLDRYGEKCSLQKSSLAFEEAIWFGTEGRVSVMVPGKGWQDLDLPEDSLVHSRMHLTQDMVKALLPALQHFVKTGELPASPPEEVPDGR